MKVILMSLSDNKYYDFPKVLTESFDPDLKRIRVDAFVTDGMDALIINPDGSINERMYDSNGNPITLGQKTEAQSIPVVLASDEVIPIIEEGTPDYLYNEISSVSSGVLTTIISFTANTASNSTRVKKVEVSGTNIGTYVVLINSTIVNKHRTYYAGGFNSIFDFTKGLPLVNGDVLTVTYLQNSGTIADVNAFIYVLEDPS
jgi:hypothetical protein